MGYTEGPTAEQLLFAEELGIEIPPGVSKAQMSKLLIDREPFEAQLVLAKRFGVSPKGRSAAVLHLILSTTIARAGSKALKDNPALRIGARIKLDDETFVIVAIGTTRGSSPQCVIELEPLRGNQILRLPAGLLADAKEA
jgi:hypothetical protein